jgi:hypothetical protein
VSGADASGVVPQGLSSFDIYVSINGGAWGLWTTVPAASPTATFTGQGGTTYAFYSIAHDLAGYTEQKSPRTEAITSVPDLIPPVTTVNGTTGANPSTVDITSGTFTLNVTGSDSGASGLASFQVFAAIDGQAAQPVGGPIAAGAPDGQGNYHTTLTYTGRIDGLAHTYRFFSAGTDGAGNVEVEHGPPGDVVFAETFSLHTTGLSVQRGSAGRSFIRYVDIGFNANDNLSGGALSQLVGSINTSSPQILLYKYDLNGTAASKTPVSLQAPTLVNVIDRAIEIDFGAKGLGGVPGSAAADGYYELDVTLPNGQTDVRHFYRLLGDVTGDGVVDNSDLAAVAAAITQTTPPGALTLNADVNGDGTVNSIDSALVVRAKGHRLAAGLVLG